MGVNYSGVCERGRERKREEERRRREEDYFSEFPSERRGITV